MSSEEYSDIIRLITTLRLPLRKKSEQRICKFLSYSAEMRIPLRVGADLAWAIADSGEILFERGLYPVTSVHSTGAPGSLSTIIAPILAAACGMIVPVVSARGSVAGAIDSLSTIPGYKTELGISAINEILKKAHLAHIEHTDLFAPADKVLWALREKTHTKEVPLLIAASLLGKQLSVGAHNGAVDIRVGPAGNAGATIDIAYDTAYTIISVANQLGMRINCIFSDSTVLGWPRLGRIDNILSVCDILEAPAAILHPHVELCIDLAACACFAACPRTEYSVWQQKAKQALYSGKANELFEKGINAHGASFDSIRQLRSEAARRIRFEIKCEGQLDVGRVSGLFKNIRGEVGPEEADKVGMEISEEAGLVNIMIPENREGLETKIKEYISSIITQRPIVSGAQRFFLSYNGTKIICQ